MLARMFGNPGASADVLGLPLGVVVLGIAIIGFVVGTVWLWRITCQHEDGDDSWRFRR
jgi:Flp pilus assembly protein TadB